MLVARIANIRFYKPQTTTSNNVQKTYGPDCFVASFGKSNKQAGSVDSVDIQMQRFPQDIDYRKQVLKNAGLEHVDYRKIRSIVGPDEIKAIIQEFSNNRDNYSAGENNINVENGTIRANLHIHTQASDGFFEVEKLLEEAAQYANKVAKLHPGVKNPFVIAITDHDTVRGTRQAVKIIAQDPKKYENLRVILGIEFTTYNNVLNRALKKPTNIDVLAYGLDPNEKKLVQFIRRTKKYKQRVAAKMIANANGFYQKAFGTKETPFNLEQVQRLYTPVREGILETHRFVESYVEIKFLLKEVILKNLELRAKLAKHYPNLNGKKLIDKIIEDIAIFYKPIDNNTKKYGGEKTLCTFLSHKLSMNPSTLALIMAQGLGTEKNQKFVARVDAMFKRYKTVSIGIHKEIPDFSDVKAALKGQKRVALGIAHPLKYLKKLDEAHQEPFLRTLYAQFGRYCTRQGFFSEVHYQSYVDGPAEISKKHSIKTLLNRLSEKYGLFKTGGFDNHDAFLWARRIKK